MPVKIISVSKHITQTEMEEAQNRLVSCKSSSYSALVNDINNLNANVTVVVVDRAGASTTTKDAQGNIYIDISIDQLLNGFYYGVDKQYYRVTIERLLAHEMGHAWQHAHNDPVNFPTNGPTGETIGPNSAQSIENTILAALCFNEVKNADYPYYTIPLDPKSGSIITHSQSGQTELSCDVKDLSDLLDHLKTLWQHSEDRCPLVLDLNGDADGDGNVIELAHVRSGDAVYWDIDNDGFREAGAWVKADDALLVLDRNANGVIDNHGELFGTQTVDGFTKLRELDGNADSKIDAGDAKFGELKIWQDLNQDGYSQAAEMKTLAQAGIKSINLNATVISQQIEGNNITHTSTVTMTNNATKTIVDAWFKYDEMNTVYAGDYTLDARTFMLPTLRGYGDLKNLSVQML